MLLAFSFIISLILSSASSTTEFDTIECDILLRFDTKFGLSVYAGREFKANELIEDMPELYVSKYIVENPAYIFKKSINDYSDMISLMEYVNEHNETHNTISLGYGHMFNHANIADGLMLRREYQGIDRVQYVTNWHLFPGDQM